MLGVRNLAAAMAVSIMLVLLPGTAEADWSPPRQLESAEWNVESQVASAMARDGRMVVAWRAWPAESNPDLPPPQVLHVRRVSRTGRAGPVHTLSTWESGDPTHLSVAVDADGDALVTWQADDAGNDVSSHVWARRLSWGGVRGPLVRVNPAGEAGAFPVAALAPTGGGAVLYQRDNDEANWELVRLSAGSRLGHSVTVGNSIPYGPRVVATPQGDFVTAANGSDGVLRGYRLRRDDTVLRRKVEYGGVPTGLGTDRHGTAYLTYQDPMQTTGVESTVFVRRWFRDGRMSTARRISPRSHTVLLSGSDTGWRGDTLVTWSHRPNPDQGYVDGYGRMLRRDGSLGPVRRLGPMPPIPPQTLLYFYLKTPRVAVDDGGNGVVAWPSQPDWDHDMAWTRRVRRDGTVGPKVLVRDNAVPVGVDVTPAGRARALLLGYARLWLRSGP
jgi:hypothetical protein